jgi:hypothetical protein
LISDASFASDASFFLRACEKRREREKLFFSRLFLGRFLLENACAKGHATLLPQRESRERKKKKSA